VVEVEYDPAAISYEQLLDVFWSSHNPAVRSGRWFDPTSQYRSVIFFHTPEQEHAAKGSAAQLEASGKLRGKLATQILSAPTFWRAEEYHQQFYEKQGRVKVELALGRGKQQHDRREDVKKREAQREIDRGMSRRRR